MIKFHNPFTTELKNNRWLSNFNLAAWKVVLEIAVGPNTIPQNRLVRWWLPSLPNTCSGYILSDVDSLYTPPHDQHYWAWFVDINGGSSDSWNMIAGDPMDLNRGSDIILEIVVETNITLQTRLVMWELPPLTNTSSDHILSDVGLF
jgi:hypothetical protein